MTIELTMLAWTLVLALVYVIAFDLVRTRQYGTKWNMGARDEAMPPLSATADRLGRALAGGQRDVFRQLHAPVWTHNNLSGRPRAGTRQGCSWRRNG